MLSRLAKMVAAATEALETYNLGDYARDIQAFFWNEVCDWYIELCKGRLLGGSAEEKLQVQRNLIFVLDTSLRLLHPVMPFVTESVWDAMPAGGVDDHAAQFLMLAAWPEPQDYERFVDEDAEGQFEIARRVISGVRAARARYRLSPKEQLDITVHAGEAELAALEAQRAFIQRIGKLGEFVIASEGERPEGSVSFGDANLEAFVKLGGLVDLAAERARLLKELEKNAKELEGVRKTLANQGFLAKAAADIVAAKRARATELSELAEKIRAQVDDLS